MISATKWKVILLLLHLESVLAAIRSIFSCTNLLLTLETVLVCLRELTMTLHWSSGFSNAMYIVNWLILRRILIAYPASPTYGAHLSGLWYAVYWTPKSHDKSQMRVSLKLNSAVLTESTFEFWVAVMVWTLWICWDLILNHKLFIDGDRIDITLILTNSILFIVAYNKIHYYWRFLTVVSLILH